MRVGRLTLAGLVITLINLVILVVALVLVLRPALTPDTASVLRGRSLEIVDAQDRVRAQIVVEPAGTTNGQAHSETVLFRLISPDGHPGIKIAASQETAGLLLSLNAPTPQEFTGVQMLSEEAGGSIRVIGGDGTESVIKP